MMLITAAVILEYFCFPFYPLDLISQFPMALTATPYSFFRFLVLTCCVALFLNQLAVSLRSLLGNDIITLAHTETIEEIQLPSISICR